MSLQDLISRILRLKKSPVKERKDEEDGPPLSYREWCAQCQQYSMQALLSELDDDEPKLSNWRCNCCGRCG